MPKTRTWHACLPDAESAPCGYELRLACGWWYQASDEDAECCHSKRHRELWKEAKGKKNE